MSAAFRAHKPNWKTNSPYYVAEIGVKGVRVGRPWWTMRDWFGERLSNPKVWKKLQPASSDTGDGVGKREKGEKGKEAGISATEQKPFVFWHRFPAPCV